MQNPNPRCWLITTPQGGDLHVCEADGWRVEEIIGGARMDEFDAMLKGIAYDPNEESRVMKCKVLGEMINGLRADRSAKEPGSAGTDGASDIFMKG